MSKEADFWEYYKKDLRPALEEFEIYRKKILGKVRTATLFILACFIFISTMMLGFGLNPPLLLIPAIVGLAAFGFAWWYFTKDYKTEFKQVIIRRIIQFCDPSLRYIPDGRVSQSTFISSTIFPQRIDRYSGEDYVSGSLGKTAIEFSEIHAEYKTHTTDSKGRRKTKWQTIFKGLYFTADFNKHFSGITVVLPDRAEKFLGFLGQKLQEFNPGRDQLIKLEDPEFEEFFVVYGSDQIEARYILSPALMARITGFKKKSGIPVYLSFTGSRLHIAMTTGKNMFEPKILSTILEFKTVQQYWDDLRLALDIVEDLNLNTRIWTKE
jgi:hypothetical protein